MKYFFTFFIIFMVIHSISSKKSKDGEKPEWAKKDIRDYNDVDMERLLDQWEEDDDPLEQDELPEHLRPSLPIDFSKIDPNNPEGILQLTKKGKTLMTFVNVAGNPRREDTEDLTKLWQTSLWNNHIQAERYLVDDNRAIFLFKDGSQAWIAKDYLIDQPLCQSVTIESKVYEGNHVKQNEEL